jgi:hypothetical protein
MNMALGSSVLDRLADASAQETALKRNDRAVATPGTEGRRERDAHALARESHASKRPINVNKSQ